MGMNAARCVTHASVYWAYALAWLFWGPVVGGTEMTQTVPSLGFPSAAEDWNRGSMASVEA